MTSNIRELQVEVVSISSLRPYERNARAHSKRQIGKIAASIKEFGWMNPILADASGTVIAGHGRLEAAKLLGLAKVPVIRISDLSPTQVRAYRLADNRLAEDAGWDESLLRIELNELIELSSDFEITATGFEMAEVDIILGAADDAGDDDASAAEPADAAGQAVSKAGDLWHCGKHRLLCGNALERAAYERLLEGEKADLVITDPPYNVKVSSISGKGRRKHDEFVMASGEMSTAAFKDFLSTVLALLAAHTISGALHYIFMSWPHLAELLAAAEAEGFEVKNLVVWDKGSGGMGSLYRSAHELILLLKHGKGSHTNNVALGAFGRNRTNMWHYRGANSFGAGRDEALAMHPTVKPVAMIADAMLDASPRNGLVLDPFAGSGTVLIAAERTGRRAGAIELDPKYVDVALRRFRRIIGKEPVHAETGMTFSEMEAAALAAVSPEMPRAAGAVQ